MAIDHSPTHPTRVAPIVCTLHSLNPHHPMWNSLLRIVNGFLEAILQRILRHLLENTRLKELALQKDQEILRLKADLQRDKDDIEVKASKISDLERDIATVRDDIRLREEHHASFPGKNNRNCDVTDGKNEEITSLQHEIQDVKDALRAREEHITSLMKAIEEERGCAVAKEAEEKLEKADGELSEKVERLMRELDESRRKEEHTAESQRRLAVRLEEQDAEMKNNLADWEAHYKILLHAEEEHVEAQRTLEEQLEINTAELDRLRTVVGEREQALYVAIRDVEQRDREINQLRNSFAASYEKLDVQDDSLATLQQELSRLTCSLEVSRDQNSSLEQKIKVKSAEAESMHADLQKLSSSLAKAEKKAAEDLNGARREIEKQTSQVTVLRQSLDHALSEGREKDDVARELKNKLKEVGDEQRRKEKELQASASRQAELVTCLNKQTQDVNALERELTDTKSRLSQLAILSEEKGLELLSTRKESDGMRHDITKAEENAAKLADEVLQLKFQLHESTDKCSELEKKVKKDESEALALAQQIETLQRAYEETQEMVLTRGLDFDETKTALESMTAEHYKLQNLLDDAREEIYQKAENVAFLSSSLQNLKNVVEELKKQKEAAERQSAETKMTMERQRDEIKGSLDSTTAECAKLQSLLDEACSNVARKSEIILSLTSSLQQSQGVIKEMETQKETFVNQSTEMQGTVNRQMQEIMRIEADLADVKKSYKTVTEELRMETKRGKDNDDKLAEAVAHVQMVNTTLREQEQALSATLEDFERKDKEINQLRSSLGVSRTELDVRGRSLEALRQELDSLSSKTEELRHQNSFLEALIKVKTSEVESLSAELQKLTGLLAKAERKAADDREGAQKEMKGLSSQVTALRRDLDRSRSEGKSKDGSVKELMNQLRKAGEEQKRKEKELQASASRQIELETRLKEHVKALERELTAARSRVTQLTTQSESLQPQLLNARKESDGMRVDISKLRQELSSVQSDRSFMEQSLRKAENNATKLTDEVLQLKSQLRGSHETCSELEKALVQDASEARLLEQRIETLQKQHDETQKAVFTRARELEETRKVLESTTARHSELENLLDVARKDIQKKTENESFLSSSLQRLQSVVEELKKREENSVQQSAEVRARMEKQGDEIKGTLDSRTAERDELRSLLDDARSDMAKKAEIIRSLTSSTQHSQSVVADMEKQRDRLVEQLAEMEQTVQKRLGEVKTLEGDLSQAKESYADLQKLHNSIAKMGRKAADDLEDARWEIKTQASQITTFREDLDRARSEAKAKNDVAQELKNRLMEALDAQRKREDELQTSASQQAELEARLRNQSEETKVLVRELTDTKGRLVQVTALSEQRELEVADTRKETNGVRDDNSKLRQELSSLIDEHGLIQRSLVMAEKNATRSTDEVLQLKLQLRDSHAKRSELETMVDQGEIADELKGTLDSTTAERDQLRNLLDSANRDIAQKTETIRSLTSSIPPEMSASQPTEMYQTIRMQVEEIKTLKEGLADVKRSHETVMEELRLETEKTKDVDNKLAELARLQAANSALQEQLEQMKEVAQARGVEALAFQRSKYEGSSKLREALAKKLTEAQAADALSRTAELPQRLQSIASRSDVKHPLEDTAEVGSSRAMTAITLDTQSPQTLSEEPEEMDTPTRPHPRRPEPIRSNTGTLSTLLEGMGVLSKNFWVTQKRNTFHG